MASRFWRVRVSICEAFCFSVNSIPFLQCSFVVAGQLCLPGSPYTLNILKPGTCTYKQQDSRVTFQWETPYCIPRLLFTYSLVCLYSCLPTLLSTYFWLPTFDYLHLFTYSLVYLLLFIYTLVYLLLFTYACWPTLDYYSCLPTLVFFLIRVTAKG